MVAPTAGDSDTGSTACRKMPGHKSDPARETSCYDILEIGRDASAAEIQAAYDRQCARLHALERRTRAWYQRQQDIEEAFHVLAHADSRQAYDRLQAGSGPEAAPSSTTLADFESEPESALAPEQSAWPPETQPQYPLLLIQAKCTERGYAIKLDASAAGNLRAVRILRQQIPESDLVFEPVQQVWLVPHAYRQILEDLFLNFASLLDQDTHATGGLAIPRYDNVQPVPYGKAAPRTQKPSGWPPPRLEPSPFPFNGIIIGLLVLLIGWNFYVIGVRQPETAAVLPTATPRPTRAPIPTPTPVPTLTPTPFSFVTSTKYERVHLRSRPDLGAASLGYLLAGDELTILARTPAGDWVRVQRGEQTGWSAAWTLNVEDRIDQLPIAAP